MRSLTGALAAGAEGALLGADASGVGEEGTEGVLLPLGAGVADGVGAADGAGAALGAVALLLGAVFGAAEALGVAEGLALDVLVGAAAGAAGGSSLAVETGAVEQAMACQNEPRTPNIFALRTNDRFIERRGPSLIWFDSLRPLPSSNKTPFSKGGTAHSPRAC